MRTLAALLTAFLVLPSIAFACPIHSGTQEQLNALARNVRVERSGGKVRIILNGRTRVYAGRTVVVRPTPGGRAATLDVVVDGRVADRLRPDVNVVRCLPRRPS